jgi:methyl acetate hydrolase
MTPALLFSFEERCTIEAIPMGRILHDASDGRLVIGVVSIVANATGVTYQGAAGKRLLGAESAMTLDTVFAIASTTKGVTAVAALHCAIY